MSKLMGFRLWQSKGLFYDIRRFRILLGDNGYVLDHQTGDHLIYYKGKSHLSVPLCNKNPMLFKRIIKTYNLKEG